MMKHWFLAVALICLGSNAQASPYFRFEPMNAVHTAGYFTLGTPIDNVAWGMETSVLKHHAEDGYLLIPGVGWSLLDAGFTKGEHYKGVFGPSVDISEPVKALLLKGLDAFAGDNTFTTLRFVLQPAQPGSKYVGLSAGPGLAVDPGDFQHLSQITGRFTLHAGLVAKF